MIYSEEKNECRRSPAGDVWRYSHDAGANMVEAKNQFINLRKDQYRKEMARLIESGSLEDIHKIVRILIQAY